MEFAPRPSRKRLPAYGWAGLVVMVVSQELLFNDICFVGQYFTPIQWTGLILFLDGVVRARRGHAADRGR